MRCYNIVSGILLILSFIDFTLAAPVLVPEKRQPGVDVVHIPKDVISVLGKRGEGDLAKLTEEFSKAWGRPIDSSEAHLSSSSAPQEPDLASPSSAPPGSDHSSSSSAPPGPDQASSSSAQLGPDQASSSSAPPGPDHASSSSAPPGSDYAPSSSAPLGPDHASSTLPPQWSQESDDGSISSGPMFTPGSSMQGSPEHPLAGLHTLPPNPYTPSPDADPSFDWQGWMKKVNEPGPWTEGVDLGPEYQAGHVQPNLGSPTDSYGGFDWEGWRKMINSPQPGPWTEGIGLGHGYQDDPLASSPISFTEPDSDRNLMTAHQPQSYPLSPTGFDKDPPYFPQPPIKTDIDPYANLPSSPTELYSYSFPGAGAHPLQSGAGLPTVPEHEVVPPTPSTNPELYLDHPSSKAADLPAADLPAADLPAVGLPATDSELEDYQAMRYALKGKAKVLD